jgi:hypothetical protein
MGVTYATPNTKNPKKLDNPPKHHNNPQPVEKPVDNTQQQQTAIHTGLLTF